MDIYKEGKDMQKMRSLTITLLKQLQHRTEQNIKVRCPKCGKKACCIKVENGLFLCWSCDQGAQFKGQLHELAKLKHSEGSSIDAGYYLRANADAKHKAEPDYTPMVDDDYEEIDEKTRSMIFPLEDEEEVNPVSQYVISARYMVKQYLKDMGISVETAMKAGVCCGYMSHKVDDSQTHDPQGYEQVAAIAYCNRVCGRIVNVKMRTVAKDPHGGYIKDFWQKSPTQPCAPYGIDCINPLRINAEPIDRLIITEGEKDRLTLMQCGFPYVISVASGCKTDIRKSHEAFAEWIAQAEEIVVCGDSDRPGRGLVKRLLKFYADQATLAELPRRCKDISEVYARYGAETVRKIILGAKELGMEDVYAAEQHADDIKRVMLGQYDHGYSIGMGPLTDRVFHLTSSGGLVVVTGIGKDGFPELHDGAPHLPLPQARWLLLVRVARQGEAFHQRGPGGCGGYQFAEMGAERAHPRVGPRAGAHAPGPSDFLSGRPHGGFHGSERAAYAFVYREDGRASAPQARVGFPGD